LDVGQRADVALRLEPMLAEEAARRQKLGIGPDGSGGRGRSKNLELKMTQGLRAPTSADLAARAVGISASAVKQLKYVKKSAPELGQKVANGVLTLGRAARIVRDREAEAKRQAEAGASANARCLRIEVRHGRFQDVLADLRDVDAIITDPPYERSALPLLGELARWADLVLKPDGILAVLYGRAHLPEALAQLSGFRPYRWAACYLTELQWYVCHARRVHSNWKPLLIYGGLAPRFADLVRAGNGDADDKERHKWGQSFAGFATIVERLTKPGQTVVDPFMGSGTTLVAANRKNSPVRRAACSSGPICRPVKGAWHGLAGAGSEPAG
jgi:hypothetical protein